MEKIQPFGQRPSKGTFDDIYNSQKYPSIEEAYKANDYAQCDFMKDEKGTVHVVVFNPKNPENKKTYTLTRQHFPAGLDIYDDQSIINIALSLI